jgi:hypothetical protein
MKSAETAMKKIRYALAHNKQLEVKLSVYGMPQRRYIDLLLSLYLEECGLIELKDRLLYCMHELAGNAHKANAKRLFFERSGFDIFDTAEYEEGMSRFKQTVSHDLSSYNRILTEQGYYVCFRFHLKGGTLALQVVNSARLLQTERERIASKIEIARCYTTLTDAYTVAEDFSEGAGLGIVMIHIMLKAIGFRNFSFSVDGDERKTISSLLLDVSTCRPVLPAGETAVSSSI